MNELEIEQAVFTQDQLSFELKDGRTISVPLAFYPTLQRATPEDREEFELYPTSAHWPALDCDIGLEGMLAGARELPVYANRARSGEPSVLALRQVPDPEAK